MPKVPPRRTPRRARMERKKPPYCHHQGRDKGYARFGTNRQIYFAGKYGSPESLAHYERACAEYLGTGRVGEKPAGGVRVAELIDAFYTWVEAHRKYQKNGKPTSMMTMLRGAFEPLLELFGPLRTGEIGANEFDALRANLLTRKRKFKHKGHKPWHASTVRRYLGLVRGLFRWGAKRGYVPKEVLAELVDPDVGLGSGGGPQRRGAVNAPVPC